MATSYQVDVTVRGGGIFGLACAYEMARRGARVRLIETRALGAGASGGTVGALAPHVPENWNPKKQFQLESLLMAPVFWAEVAAAGGQDAGYAQTGRLQPLADAEAVARAESRAEGAATLWQGQASWRVVPAGQFSGLVPPSPTGLLVHDTLTGRANPRGAVAALAAAITALGGQIVIGEPSDQTPDQGPVIWATGAPGLADLNAALAHPVGGGVKGQSALLAYDAGPVPQLYAEGLLIVPHADGTVAVGSTAERDYDDPTSTDAQLEALIDRARQMLPPLGSAPVIDRWAGIRPRASSRAPMLGAWPDRPGHFVANGGFMIGFGMAPKVAATMADLVLEGRDTIPAGFRVTDNL